jgi:hypothetical protein
VPREVRDGQLKILLEHGTVGGVGSPMLCATHCRYRPRRQSCYGWCYYWKYRFWAPDCIRSVPRKNVLKLVKALRTGERWVWAFWNTCQS